VLLGVLGAAHDAAQTVSAASRADWLICDLMQHLWCAHTSSVANLLRLDFLTRPHAHLESWLSK
jgi:hypothetical protein